MQLTHHFHVPSDIDETWTHFQDVAGLAGCFPGAQVTSVDGDDFTGFCKVKLGPIALVYNGAGQFSERDESGHRMTVVAKGKDKRGNGTAAATATLTMSPATAGGTDVDVLTDLAVTGKPAQFGRGLMQDVSDKLLGQFVACLQQQLDPAEPDPADPGAEPTPPPVPQSANGAAPGTMPASTSTAPEPTIIPESSARAARQPTPQSRDALDLGATVLPVLLKNYWKPVAVGVLALVAITRWVKR